MKLVLHLDKGLAAHLRAYTKGFRLYGGTEATAIALIREGLIEARSHDVVAQMMALHLPKRMRPNVVDKPLTKPRAVRSA